MVSLTRLEKQIQLLQAAGRQPSEEMQVLAGLQRIQYVFVYPESGDLVLAGRPATGRPATRTASSAPTAAGRWCGWTTWWSSSA